jgi:hypothetical protein
MKCLQKYFLAVVAIVDSYIKVGQYIGYVNIWSIIVAPSVALMPALMALLVHGSQSKHNPCMSQVVEA